MNILKSVLSYRRSTDKDGGIIELAVRYGQSVYQGKVWRFLEGREFHTDSDGYEYSYAINIKTMAQIIDWYATIGES
jgi:hypothetical protein